MVASFVRLDGSRHLPFGRHLIVICSRRSHNWVFHTSTPIPLYPIPPYTLYPILSSHIYDNTAPLYPLSPTPLIPLQHFTSSNLKLSKLETPNPGHPIPLYPILSSHIYDNPNPLNPISPIPLIPLQHFTFSNLKLSKLETPNPGHPIPLYPFFPVIFTISEYDLQFTITPTL